MKNEEQEDIDFEPEDELGSAGAAKAKMQKLRDELEKAKAERQEYLDGWQRSKADAINARQEILKQAERTGSRAAESLIEDLIPALDGFDLAAGSPAWETVAPEWRSGVDQIRNQILEVLTRHGVERFGKIGEPIDHRIHETMQEVDDMPGDSGTIVRILRYGYKKGDRVLRPAQVIAKR
jgi:molecular chaperone GrpE